MDNVVIFKIKNDLNKYFDKESYVYKHSLRVFNSVINHYPTNTELSLKLQIIALLHDVAEDTEYNIDKLKDIYFNTFNEFFEKDFIKDVFNGLAAITRDKNQSYMEYIKNKVKPNYLGSIIKMLDLEDNLFNCFIEKNNSLANRYIRALTILNN